MAAGQALRQMQVRARRAAGSATIACVAIGVLGMSACSPASDDVADEPAAPAPSASPVASPTATASVEPEDPRFDDSPDGIADDALPALATERSDPYLDYPLAHVIEDWVWDVVGEGWAVEVAAMQQEYFNDEFVQPTAVMYLVSPEDTHFELFELPERAWDDARVVSWREDQDVAMVWWARPDAERGRTGHGAAVDLATGELDDLAFGVYGESSEDIRFITANAQGDELWRAESEAGFKYYRWSDGADEDGWVASALVDQFPDADAAADTIGWTGPVTAEDGDSVLLRAGGPSGDGGQSLVLMTYALSTDTVERFTFSQYPGSVQLMDAVFIGVGEVEATMSYQEDSFDPDAPWTEYRVRYAIDGSGAVADVPEGSETWADWADPYVGVRFGEASDIALGVEFCGC
ncbi:hypothetical protein [uncultured Demequina sp.]|uniref:hypothetical protein n=1 Tax=uncultured Demequina sp. TaxID=693499 RepID=UPI0025CDAEEE|nr:hypothetical protein [uncultured Demequina sp.]